MKLKITRYNKMRHECEYITDKGVTGIIDPFVGCAFPTTDEEYMAGKGYELVGKWFEVPDNVLIVGTMCPSEGQFIPIEMEE